MENVIFIISVLQFSRNCPNYCIVYNNNKNNSIINIKTKH